MNTIYVVMVIHKNNSPVAIAKKAHSSLEEAQEFCTVHYGATQCTPHLYKNKHSSYFIKECTL